MKYVIAFGLALLCIVGAGAAYVYDGLTHRPDISSFGVLKPAATTAPNTSLRVTFLGVSTLLFNDGETAILLDGFFTRPNLRQVLLGKISPDKALIKNTLQRAGVTRLAAVIVNHSHYDHVMDSPEVALQTDALLVGSESTANAGRGGRVPEQRISVRRPCDSMIFQPPCDSMTFGRFAVTLLQSAHAPSPFTGGEITEPLVPPVRASAYREGTSFAILIEHDGRRLLVNASAGYAPVSLGGRRAEVVFLGIGQLGKQSPDRMAAYWREMVSASGARRVIPIHWDDFTRPIDEPLQPMPFLLDDMNVSMKFLLAEGTKSGVEVKLPEAWTVFDPFDGLPAPSR